MRRSIGVMVKDMGEWLPEIWVLGRVVTGIRAA